MLDDVVQRLLADAEHDDRLRRRQRDLVGRCGEPAAHARVLLEAARLPFERGDDALVEDRGPQVVHDARRCGDRRVDEPVQLLELAHERRIVGDAALEPLQLELDAGQRAADVIVQLAGDGRTLALADARKVAGKLAQLFARAGQRDLGLLLSRDVGRDAVPQHARAAHAAGARRELDIAYRNAGLVVRGHHDHLVDPVTRRGVRLRQASRPSRTT